MHYTLTKRKQMPARYHLFQGRDSQYYFSLHAENDKIILQSEGYTSKQNALGGISSCRINSPLESRYTRMGSAPGCWFVLKANNPETIGRSETYTTTQARDHGIDSVKKNGPSAPLDDRT